MSLRIIALLAVVSSVSCRKQILPFGNSPELSYLSNLQAALRPYFENFINEAEERGIVIDITEAGISGVIEEIDEEHAAGTCS